MVRLGKIHRIYERLKMNLYKLRSRDITRCSVPRASFMIYDFILERREKEHLSTKVCVHT
jgi:hypothetical protein